MLAQLQLLCQLVPLFCGGADTTELLLHHCQLLLLGRQLLLCLLHAVDVMKDAAAALLRTAGHVAARADHITIKRHALRLDVPMKGHPLSCVQIAAD